MSAKITIDQTTKTVTKVEGGKHISDAVENPTTVYVEQNTASAKGCPAYIYIAGVRYQI